MTARGLTPGSSNMFSKGSGGGTRSGSVGLGMAISRTIVELHGGTCSAANSPDGGALVSVKLPYKAR